MVSIGYLLNGMFHLVDGGFLPMGENDMEVWHGICAAFLVPYKLIAGACDGCYLVYQLWL
jgi:hypothetical protein